MKKMIDALVVENTNKNGICYMRVYVGELALSCCSGQFVNLYTGLESAILPRPISICEIDKEKGILLLVYQIVGKGTEYFSKLKQGDLVRILGPLGNGFELITAKSYALIGGGIGVAPLLQLAKDLNKQEPDSKITAFLGFRSEAFLIQKYTELPCSVHVASDDGQIGFKGNIIELLHRIPFDYKMIYSCGPRPMLRGLAKFAQERNIQCQMSMEEHMACGIGACVGCAIKIGAEEWEYKKVCKDGPVFYSSEVVWDD